MTRNQRSRFGASRARGAALILHLRDDERGVGVIMAVGVSAVVFLLTATWASLAERQVAASGRERLGEEATHAAEAGVHAALSTLSANPEGNHPFTVNDYLTVDGNRVGEYLTTVDVAPGGTVYDAERVITSVGYSPEAGRANTVTKQISVVAEITPVSEFDKVLFASDGHVQAGNGLEVEGDVYSAGDAEWDQSSIITGDVHAWGGIASRGTVTGNLSAAGINTVDSCGGIAPNCGVWVRSGTVNGNIFAAHNPGGNGGGILVGDATHSPDATARVAGNVAWAYDDIRLTGSHSSPPISGIQVKGSQPSLPVELTMPTFSWATYAAAKGGAPGAISPSTFDTKFDNAQRTLGSLAGLHDITSGTGTVTLGGTYCAVVGTCPLPLPEATVTSWRMNGDLTIYTDEPVVLSADILNTSTQNLELTIITTSSAAPAVTFTGNVTPPSTISVLVYAPNGQVTSTTSGPVIEGGAIYAEDVDFQAAFEIHHADFSGTPGFTWSLPRHAPTTIVEYYDEPPP